MLCLKEANLEDAAAEYAFISELPQCENGFTNECPGVSEAEFTERVLPRMIAFSHGEELPAGYVPETSLFLWEDGEIVGLFRVRHALTEWLREGAGHIGYSISKSARGRGLATSGLALALEYARGVVAEDEIYMSVNRDNAASLRVQQKNGAYIHHSDCAQHYTRIKLRRSGGVGRES